ncbi:MAG: hypothetical protein AAF799_23215 [Myxococcota bacterium]
MPIPDAGPWALPAPLPPFVPPPPIEPVFVDFTKGLGCPPCGRTQESYRQLRDGFLVCGTGGCSFER